MSYKLIDNDTGKDIIKTYSRISPKNRFKNTSKEQRAKALNNIICPRCKYQNHKVFIQKYGKCHLCGTTLDNNYFKKIMLKKLKGVNDRILFRVSNRHFYCLLHIC